ncbi:MAG: hypothetical protein ACFB5Z_16725 [Elainellaceae cyanobacterium]
MTSDVFKRQLFALVLRLYRTGLVAAMGGLMASALVASCATSESGLKPEALAQDSASFDPFREAVNKATEAAALGRIAESEADWQAIAQMWQTAADLMRVVPPDHPQYAVAQQRAEQDYVANFQVAQKRAGMTDDVAQTADDDRLTKVDFGKGWPFVVDGELRCEPVSVGDRQLKLVTLHSVGQIYAVNGPAQARASERGWRNVDEVWRSSSIGSGKAPINWVLMRAEADCGAS